MLELNVAFLDLYKNVDNFIKDAYSSQEGVSEYIRLMEQNTYKGKRYVLTWDADHGRLKQVRYIRNQLSHNVGLDSDICDESDYEWLKAFKECLFSGSDPLAKINREESAERQRLEERQRRARELARIEEERLRARVRARLEEERRAEEERREREQMQKVLQSAPKDTAPLSAPQTASPERRSLWQRIKDFFS